VFYLLCQRSVTDRPRRVRKRTGALSRICGARSAPYYCVQLKPVRCIRAWVPRAACLPVLTAAHWRTQPPVAPGTSLHHFDVDAALLPEMSGE
jgi:hypothetical protein